MKAKSALDELLSGSIDMHLHIGPDVLPDRVDPIEAAEQAACCGIRAIVLKNHSCPTTPVALLARKQVPEVETFGSICLDYEIGGLNVAALERQAGFGLKVVWMPTFSAVNCRKKLKTMGLEFEGDGFSILGDDGKLVPEIDPILDIIKEHDMVLATGHISPAEIFALIEEAKKKNIENIVLTHPLDAEGMEKALTMDDLRKLVRMGAFIEHTIVAMLPTEMSRSPQERVEIIRSIGAEYFIMGTDLGQEWNMPPAEGLRFFMAILLRNGLTEKEIEVMAKTNPATLLGLK